MLDLDHPNRHKTLFHDKVFTAHEWHYQKSWKRHLPDGTWFWVLEGFWHWVLYVTAIAFLVCVYHQWIVPLGAPDWPTGPLAGSSWQVFNLTAFALSLLMVFKTNSSYSRWWEARTTWGFIFNAVRNMARRAISGFAEEDEVALSMFVRWSAALPYLLKDHLTLRASPRLKELLPESEVGWTDGWAHKPHGGAQILTEILRQVALSQEARVAVDDQIMLYVNLVGACERINRTAIPQAYTRHTSRFLLLWLSFLPFTLWPVYGWASPAIMAVVSFLLIGTENIGIQIEEPFCLLPMEAFCKALSDNVLEMYRNRTGSRARVTSVLSGGKPTPPQQQQQQQQQQESTSPGSTQRTAGIAAVSAGDPPGGGAPINVLRTVGNGRLDGWH